MNFNINKIAVVNLHNFFTFKCIMCALFWQCSIDFSRFYVQSTLFLIFINILQKKKPASKELLI